MRVFNHLCQIERSQYELKALANGELKLLPDTSDDYYKLRCTLADLSCLSDADKKELGNVKFHTYRLQEDKKFTVFICVLHYTTTQLLSLVNSLQQVTLLSV